MDEAQAATTLFPDLPINTDAARSTPAAKPTPVAVAQPTVAPVAKVEETRDAAMDRMDKAFGLGKYTPDADGRTAADRDAEAAAGAKAAEAQAVDWIDPSNPDAALASPVLTGMGLSKEQGAKLEALHQQMAAAAIDRQSTAWAAESEQVFANHNGRQELRDAQTAIAKFGSPELRAVLNKTGLGNHQALVRFAAAALRSNPFRNY